MLKTIAAFDRIGLPEGLYPLAQAAVYLAGTDKSNSLLGVFDALKQVRESSRQNAAILHAQEEVKGRGIPEWIQPQGELGAKVISMPTREQINLPVQEQLIVELYSK